ncbi:probable N-acetyltransferase HLS1 [Olea europaea var. sylvestris]|uniref:probable N-acetyltransferase HLS1 n=1 Tax=Olea europaea var. sylvestris TaxID=158386 RepID=UPI000C1D10C6|nr:probable N-acetyltransferase HLS1 [Olea europaea var. sylvestris]
MSSIIEAENLPSQPAETPLVIVREYDEERDTVLVAELERRCEMGQRGKLTLVTDHMGDPICRLRNFSTHVMLVAEYGNRKEIVGTIRGCIKTVTIGQKSSSGSPIYVKLAYILGLRVSSKHRRLGIGTKLVQQLEEWCRQNGADYAYMATDGGNQPSLNLFTLKCNYVKFRNPKVLVQPVHLHYKPLGSGITIISVSPQLSESIYRRIFSHSEFFPEDIDCLLCNKLNLGTFMALTKNSLRNWTPRTGDLPPSFAILSIWNTKEVYKLQLKGVSGLTYAACLGSRVIDALMPWLKFPSLPNILGNFGFYFLYGLHMEGKDGSNLMKSLCAFAHDIARDDKDCRVLVAEVGQMDPVGEAIPHWRKFSWDQDIWCIKNLRAAQGEDNRNSQEYWIKSQISSSVIFVDPRDN